MTVIVEAMMRDLSSKLDRDCEMIENFAQLIKEYEFSIPCYQRAYCWTVKQVELFIADVAEHARNADKRTQYYLGHFILEATNDRKLEIIDGQQRLTTIAIFFAVCNFRRAGSLTPPPSLRLNIVEYDNDRFQEMLCPNAIAAFTENQERRQKEATASLERVVEAMQTVFGSFANSNDTPSLLSDAKIDAYLKVISEAAVSVAIHKNKAVAAQIFELHNTRGVLLTETEKVKALLMKYVYLNRINADRDVNEIQAAFANIYRLEEMAADASFRGGMGLDEILAHHLRAIDDGKGKSSFAEPQSVEGENGCLAYVRKKLNADSLVGIQYAKDLANEFANSMKLVSENFVMQDKKEPLVGDVILLNQRRSMIFLLCYFRTLSVDQNVDKKLLQRWESFLFLWDCHDAFYNMKSGKKDNLSEIYNQITKDCSKVAILLEAYYSGKKDFAYRPFKSSRRDEPGTESVKTGLAEVVQDYMKRFREHFSRRAYHWGHWHWRYQYWLYKYEIEYENKSSFEKAGETRISLRKLFKENAVTLDHIVPHELEWKALSVKEETVNNINCWKDAEDKKQAEETWKKIAEVIDGIGNLVLLNSSNNTSLQNCVPIERAIKYKKWGLNSVSYKEVGEWKDPKEWQGKIEARGNCLIKWMQEYFTNNDTWAAKDSR